MGLIFRQRFRILPGVHLNLSANGVSVSLGVPGATINLSPTRRARLSLGIPGTGLSYRTSLNPQTSPNPENSSPLSIVQVNHEDPSSPIVFGLPTADLTRTIQSAAVEDLVLAGNTNLQKLIKESYENHEQMAREVREMENTAIDAERSARWMDNFLFRLFLKDRISKHNDDAQRKRQDYEEAKLHLDAYGLKFDWHLADDIRQIYDDLLRAFQAASKSSVIWDVASEKLTDQFRERTVAATSVERKEISFSLGRPEYMPAGENEEWKVVPQIDDASGSVIYIFPAFFIFSGKTDFAVIEPKDIEVSVQGCNFHEEKKVPDDARVTGQTWKKTNKDGSPDKRFKENYRIPIVTYGKLRLASGKLIEEEYLLSNLNAAIHFGTALERFCNWFKNHNLEPTDSECHTNRFREASRPSLEGIRPMELGDFIERFNAKRNDLMNPLLVITKENNIDASVTLSAAFQNVGFSMCGADKVVDVEEAKVIAILGKLFPALQPVSFESWFNSLKGKSDDEWVDILSRGRQKFGAVYLLRLYDDEHGTKHADELRQLLYEFALVIATVDGQISAEEANYLQELRQDIYQEHFSSER